MKCVPRFQSRTFGFSSLCYQATAGSRDYFFPLGFIVLSLFFILSVPNIVAGQDQDYRFWPQGMIKVSVYAGGEEQMSADLTVSAPRRIKMSMLEMVAAGGMMVGERYYGNRN